MKSSLLLTLLILALAPSCLGLVAFVNQKDELVILDLDKRRVVERFANKSLVQFFESAAARPYTHHFDMQEWRELSSRVAGDFIKKQTWGDKTYLLYPDKLLVIKDTLVQDWSQNLSLDQDDKFSDMYLYNDSIVVYTSKSRLQAPLCTTPDTLIAKKGGVQSLLPYEPLFFLRKYDDKLSISSVYYPMTEYFLAHDMEDQIVDYTVSELMYMLTPYAVYSINPILRKMEVILERKPYMSFGRLLTHGHRLYVLSSDQSLICFDLSSMLVTALTYIEMPPQSLGVDGEYVFIASGSEIYCLKPENLEVHHLIRLNEDKPQTAILKILNY